MRTVLRKIQDGLFFQGPDQWTADPAEALDFKMIDRALQFVEKWRLTDVEVAFCFKDSHCVTGLPRERITVGYSEK
jgi:hypothetical protein